MSDVTSRLFQLLALLQSGRRYTGSELADRLGVSVRSVRRDIDRLRTYGYRIDAQPGPDGFYRLAAGEHLPPLVLDDGEAVAILSALSLLAATGDQPGSLGEAADRVVERLDQVLPKRLRPKVAYLRRATRASPVNAPTTHADTVAVLARAIDERRVVHFEYRGPESTTHRVVEPHHLVARHLAWYLVGWDRTRADWRTFRLDRLGDVRPRADAFHPRELPEGSVDEHLDHGFGRGRERVALTVEAARDDVAAALAYQDADLEVLGPRTTRVRLQVADWRWLLLVLAALDADLAVEEPRHVARSVERFARRVLGDPAPCRPATPRRWFDGSMDGRVTQVHVSPVHGFSKRTVDRVTLIEGVGVEGDAHAGVTVQHRSRVRANPSTPNMRQVHLIHDELFDALRAAGHEVAPGDLGENITTHDVDLLALPVGTRLAIGDAVVVLTGLRNPCQQINAFQDGLLRQVLHKDDDGTVTRLAGVMGIVARGGAVAAGDPIRIELPAGPHHPLDAI